MKRLILPLLALAVTACSNTSLPAVTTPSVVGPSVSGVSGGVSSIRLTDPSQPSCPSQPPSGLVVLTNGSGGAEAHWGTVANAADYLLEVSKRDMTGAYVNVEGFPVGEERNIRSFALRENGHYQARIRTHACNAYGDWSQPVEFSIDGAVEGTPSLQCDGYACEEPE